MTCIIFHNKTLYADTFVVNYSGELKTAKRAHKILTNSTNTMAVCKGGFVIPKQLHEPMFSLFGRIAKHLIHNKQDIKSKASNKLMAELDDFYKNCYDLDKGHDINEVSKTIFITKDYAFVADKPELEDREENKYEAFTVRILSLLSDDFLTYGSGSVTATADLIDGSFTIDQIYERINAYQCCVSREYTQVSMADLNESADLDYIGA